MAVPTWLNAANVITLLRVPLVIPGAWLLWRGDYKWVGLGFVVAAALTDLLDGMVARATGRITDFGKTWDPLADKVATFLVGVVLVLKYGVPWWIFGAALARDLAIIIGAAFVIKKIRRVLPSIFLGKAAAGMIVLYGLAAIIAPAWLGTRILLWGAAVLIPISALGYLIELIKALRMARDEPTRVPAG
jgi:phosphatidylglycerophosphate synthase